MSDEPDRERTTGPSDEPWWSVALFEAAWFIGAGAICSFMMARHGWGAWSFLGLPAFLIVAKLWLYFCRRVGLDNRKLARPADAPADTSAAKLDGDPGQYRHIRIIKVPRGAAPEWVRDAWVGLTLPLGDHPQGDPRLLRRFAVTSFWRRRFFPETAPRFEPADFFPVYARQAIEVLQKTQPDAAWWWTENTPHLLQPAARLIFRRDECELEP